MFVFLTIPIMGYGWIFRQGAEAGLAAHHKLAWLP
jgi:hypothetical protein